MQPFQPKNGLRALEPVKILSESKQNRYHNEGEAEERLSMSPEVAQEKEETMDFEEPIESSRVVDDDMGERHHKYHHQGFNQQAKGVTLTMRNLSSMKIRPHQMSQKH